MSIGIRIREARLEAGLSQEELASAVGVNQGTVSAWETSETRRIGRPFLSVVAKATGVTEEWLRTGATMTRAHAISSPATRDALTARLRALAEELLVAARQLEQAPGAVADTLRSLPSDGGAAAAAEAALRHVQATAPARRVAARRGKRQEGGDTG